MKTIRVASCLILLAISSPAQEAPILQLYRNILTQSSKVGIPKDDEIFSKVNEVTIGASTEAEISAVLPLAMQCIHSTNTEVRKDGFVFLISTIMRPDSAKLLGPYIDDLGEILDETDTTPRHTIFYLLGSMKPELPAKAIAYLNANLENSRNSTKETFTIAISLLEATPADASTLHKVLMVVSNRSDAGLTNGVIRQLGLSKSRLSEAMDFISANLNKEDPYLRVSAVDAVSRLDKDKRALFSSQLTRIASDPREPQDVRKQATQALEP